MPSQQDVANLAKVSFMTVSRVINNQPNVKEETRLKVLSAIRELGYYPDATARALNTGKTKNIGVVFPHEEYIFSHPFFVELSIALEEQLSKRGYHLFLGMNRTGGGYEDSISFLSERKVDGLILIAPLKDDPIIDRLKKADLPYIFLNGRGREDDSTFVDTDNIQGTEFLMHHLFELGHERIAFVTGNMSEINANDRYNTYINELKKMDIKFDNKLIYMGDWSIESGYSAFNTLIKRNDDITAIVFSNDQMALGGIRAAYEKNIYIPEDISICGYDNTKYAHYSVPSLTTIHQPLSDLTEAATEMIISRIEGKSDISSVIIPAELKVGESSRRID